MGKKIRYNYFGNTFDKIKGVFCSTSNSFDVIHFHYHKVLDLVHITYISAKDRMEFKMTAYED